MPSECKIEAANFTKKFFEWIIELEAAKAELDTNVRCEVIKCPKCNIEQTLVRSKSSKLELRDFED